MLLFVRWDMLHKASESLGGHQVVVTKIVALLCVFRMQAGGLERWGRRNR